MTDDLTNSAAVWAAFTHDPRERPHAELRAADADRDLVLRVLATAYAEGRVDREEHDERADRAGGARTLGQLTPLVADLVPTSAPRGALDPIVTAGRTELQARAQEAWLERRRQAVVGFLGPTVICWVIYLVFAVGDDGLGLPWPLIVTAATGFHLARTATSGASIRREELAKLEKKQAKALRKRSWRP